MSPGGLKGPPTRPEQQRAPSQPSQRGFNLPANCPWPGVGQTRGAMRDGTPPGLASQGASRCGPQSGGGCARDAPRCAPTGGKGPAVSASGLPSSKSFDFKASAEGRKPCPRVCRKYIHGGKTDAVAGPARPVAQPPRPARGRAWVGPGVGRACGTRPLSPRWACARAQWLFQGRRAGSGPPHLALVIIGLETRRCIRGTDPWLRGGPW